MAVRRTAQIAVQLLPSLSFRHQLGFSEQRCCNNDWITHISTAVYSQVLIYTAESTGASMERTKMPNIRNCSKGDSNPGSLDCGSGILPLSYHAPVPNHFARCSSHFTFQLCIYYPICFRSEVTVCFVFLSTNNIPHDVDYPTISHDNTCFIDNRYVQYRHVT